jgi:hypothetical protein
MAMNHVLFNIQSSTENLGMDFSGGLDSYAAQYGFPDLTNTNLSIAYDVGGENLRWAHQVLLPKRSIRTDRYVSA